MTGLSHIKGMGNRFSVRKNVFRLKFRFCLANRREVRYNTKNRDRACFYLLKAETATAILIYSERFPYGTGRIYRLKPAWSAFIGSYFLILSAGAKGKSPPA